MEIEILIGTEELLNLYLIPDIANIVLQFLNFNNIYNQNIDRHITLNNRLSRIVSLELEREFDIRYHIEYELFNILDHCEHWEHPTFIEIVYNYSPQIDIQFEILYNNWVWEVSGNIEPGYYSDCDYL